MQKQAEQPTAHDPQAFAENMTLVMALWGKIMQHSTANAASKNKGMGHTDSLHIYETFVASGIRAMRNPKSLMEQQVDMMRDYGELWINTQERLMGKTTEAFIPDEGKDRRFEDDAWKDSAWFDYLRQNYLLTAKWLEKSASNIQGLDQHTAHKLSFFTRQLIDALSPSNFFLTNPEVQRETLESNAENLVKGMQNLLTDIERGKGQLRIRMTDEDAFTPGENIAATPGKVVYQNDLMQLIQYTPQTKKVFKTPLLLIPAWINKYYILDLQPKNSYINWLVEQGYTVFVVSWVNPDKNLGRKSFDDYVLEGPLAAIDAIEEATGEREINAIGYCLGGTLLATTLSYLQENGHADRVKSATYLTTMVDFSEAGDLTVFIDESQIQNLEARMSETGYLDGNDMAVTFNMLRSNDLIWSFVVNNYLLGRDLFPFDLLYWNSDSTRMPAVMHSFYLRNMYQKNRLIKPGGIEIDETPINISKIKVPSYLLATEQDHIAPWKAAYAATQFYDAPVTFTLAESGHIAGVVNHPTKGKYGHWTNDELPTKPEAWLEGATAQKGSWWPHWHVWMEDYNGELVPARKPKNAIENAPGSYVKVRS